METVKIGIENTRQTQIHLHLVNTWHDILEYRQEPDGNQQDGNGIPHDVRNKERVETVLQLLLVNLEIKCLAKEEQVTGNHKEQRHTHGDQRHTRIIDQPFQIVRHMLAVHHAMNAEAPVIIYKIEMPHHHHHRQRKPQTTDGLGHQLVVRHIYYSLNSGAKIQRKSELRIVILLICLYSYVLLFLCLKKIVTLQP